MTTTTAAPAPGLGKALKTLRLASGMTLEQTSAVAGVSISYLSRVENGDATPTPAWVFKTTTKIGSVLDRQAVA